jgi:S-adenosylmethionine hydrolase
MPGILSLMTDFGTLDHYVGVMKSVMLTKDPLVQIIDITHDIEPQNIDQAKFLTRCSYEYFNENAIHIIIVDPGVGTDRLIVILQTPGGFFIGPDNGVLSEIIKKYSELGIDAQYGLINVPNSCKAFALDRKEFWMNPVSNTFHGRDIIAPIAVLLNRTLDPSIYGTEITKLKYSPLPTPLIEEQSIIGSIVYCDRFGNLISNIHSELINEDKITNIEIAKQKISKIASTFQNGNSNDPFTALIGSHGYLEISKYSASAAKDIGIVVGDEIKVEYTKQG